MKKQRICRMLVALTLLLCVVNFFILPDTVVTRYSNINGVESHVYGGKIPNVLLLLAFAAIGCFLLKRSRDQAEQYPVKLKPQAKPGKFLLLAGWIFIAMGLLGNVVLFLNNL